MADETLEASPSAGRTRELVPGATLGKYRLDRILGSGGMGVVWAAHDPDLERAVALKVLRYEDPSPELRTRLLREARAMARLKHPNVLTVYEVDSDRDRDFIAMELVEGASLDAWLATKPSRDEIWQAILGAGRGLAAAHRAGLVHRDFKPHNVLRSHDGRILVTDFGLARGQGDAVAMEDTLPVGGSGLEATVPIQSSSADEPLTRTGTLVGTPAYMAPEQFTGAASGPRTDQFAYCVTAWQLFAGERPFRGETLDELRRASGAGVAHVKATMPGAIRSVLARGLDPDPGKRWPDMNALLHALERARAGPRRWLFAGAGVIVVGLGVALVVVATAERESKQPAITSLCPEKPEVEMAKAWSPENRAELVRKHGDLPGIAYIAGELDAFATQWIGAYALACFGRRETRTFAKIGCLLGERDQVANLGELVSAIPAAAYEDAEMGGVLPRVEACDRETPVTPPTLPDDPVLRERIRKLRTELTAARFAPPTTTLPALPGLLAEAQAIGWDPVVAEAHQVFGEAALKAKHMWNEARDHYKQANEIARRSHHFHLEAETWIHLLWAEFDAASEPKDLKAFEKLVAQARLAVRNAGDDPVFDARITHAEAMYDETRGRTDEAILKLARARREAITARDWSQAVRIVEDEAIVLMRRNEPDDPGRAWKALAETDQMATRLQLSANKRRPLVHAMQLVARLRNDLASLHDWADREPLPKPPDGAIDLTGTVTGYDGKPVAGATVVAWRGTLQGDEARVYGTRRFSGDIVSTDAEGKFKVLGVRDGAIIAEFAGGRSNPRMIGNAPLALTINRVRSVGGVINFSAADAKPTGLVAIAHFDLGPDLAWQSVTAVEGRKYSLVSLPSQDAVTRLDNILDPNAPKRRLEALDADAPLWGVGPRIDAIVRGGRPEVRPKLWVFRGRVTAKTHADLEAHAKRALEVVTHDALVVGLGDQTPEGARVYEPGDRHAIFLSNRPGEVTVCVTDDAPPECQTLQIVAAGEQHTHVVRFDRN